MTPKERAKEALNQWAMYKALGAVDRRIIEDLVTMAIGNAEREILDMVRSPHEVS